jgi:ATP-dependent Clp protease ATP-binding subunit ClpA
MNGYNFTERVRKVLAMAREEAVRLSHEYVGTEHILLAVLAEGEGVAATVIQNLGVELDALRSRILDVVKGGRAGPTNGPDLPYTSRAKKVLELAMSEARDLKNSYVGTEHLLLGLLREEKGIAAQVLTDAGVTLDKAREETLRILGTEMPSSSRVAESADSFAKRKDVLIVRRPAAEHLPKSARRLREIIGSAHDVAVERQSPIIAPTHLAIALLRHEGGMANAALDRLNFDRAAVLSALNEVAPRGTTPVDPEGVVTPAPEVVVAIEAMEELRRESNAATAGSHHLLLALIMTAPDVDFAFAGQHVDVNMIRESVRWLSG